MGRCVSQKPQSIQAEKQVRFSEQVEIFVIGRTTLCDVGAPSLPPRRLAAPRTNRKRDLSPMLPSSKIFRSTFLGCRWESGRDHARDQAPTRPGMDRCRDEAPRPVIARSRQAGAPCHKEHRNLKARTNFDMASKKRLEARLESRTRFIEQAFEILDREMNVPLNPERNNFQMVLTKRVGTRDKRVQLTGRITDMQILDAEPTHATGATPSNTPSAIQRCESQTGESSSGAPSRS